jgi:hypothetical protein
MILQMEKGEIKIVQDSCENTESALIYLEFKDGIITNKSEVFVLIDDKPLTQIKSNIWRIDQTVLRGKENLVIVGLKNNGITKIYKSNFLLQSYISFGKLGVEKLPQVILDLNQKIEELENKIKKLENKMNVF